MWRAEDDDLLSRLEDEEAVLALFRSHVGGDAKRPHERAAGMATLAWKLEGGEEAKKLARGGDARALGALIEARAGSAPRFAEIDHHVALYYAKVADAVSDTSPEGAIRARVRSIAAWLSLASEERYLAELARDIVAGAMPDIDVARALAEIPIEPLDELGRQAEAGARTLSARGRAALGALARIEEAVKLASATEAVAMRARRRAEMRRTAAIEAALQPLTEALTEASAQNEAPERRGEILAGTTRIWEWAERDEEVEHFVVDQVTPLAWEVYRASKWNALGALLRPFAPIVESLAARIENDPARIAFAAPCAQILMFFSELETTLERQIAAGERTLRVCPSHRNGRLVMASYLCDRAIAILEKGGLGPDKTAEAKRAIERAEQLYPASKRLAPAKELLADVEKRRPFGFGGP